LTWLILGRGNFAWSGIEEENVLVVLTTLSGILFGWIISVMLCALRRKTSGEKGTVQIWPIATI